MVGDNHQRALLGDLFQATYRDIAVDIEVLQHLLDRIQPLQVAMEVGELLKFGFMQQRTQYFLLPGGRPCFRPQVVDNVVETKHSGSSSVLL